MPPASRSSRCSTVDLLSGLCWRRMVLKRSLITWVGAGQMCPRATLRSFGPIWSTCISGSLKRPIRDLVAPSQAARRQADSYVVTMMVFRVSFLHQGGPPDGGRWSSAPCPTAQPSSGPIYVAPPGHLRRPADATWPGARGRAQTTSGKSPRQGAQGTCLIRFYEQLALAARQVSGWWEVGTLRFVGARGAPSRRPPRGHHTGRWGAEPGNLRDGYCEAAHQQPARTGYARSTGWCTGCPVCWAGPNTRATLCHMRCPECQKDDALYLLGSDQQSAGTSVGQCQNRPECGKKLIKVGNEPWREVQPGE